MSQLAIECSAIEHWTFDTAKLLVAEALQEAALTVCEPIAEHAISHAAGNFTIEDEEKKKAEVARKVKSQKDLAKEIASKRLKQKVCCWALLYLFVEAAYTPFISHISTAVPLQIHCCQLLSRFLHHHSCSIVVS